MEGLFTNNSAKQDFFSNALVGTPTEPCAVLVAVAFFTDPQPLIQLAERGYQIKMVVRLGYPTNPKALECLIHKPGILVRFVNDRTFHPKLYIFAEKCAIVGSSNLTYSALTVNQEVNVSISVDDPRYDELVSLFGEYWIQAKVLDKDQLRIYAAVFEKWQWEKSEEVFEETLRSKQGRISIKNIERGLDDPNASSVFMEDYAKTYQEFLSAFRLVEGIYRKFPRKVPEEDLPLRIEIDQFFNYIREAKAPGETYNDRPILFGPELEGSIESAIKEWISDTANYLREKIVSVSFPTINRVMRSEEAIHSASIEDILEALSLVHSFHDRQRFFPGGHKSHKKAFVEQNDLEQIKHCFTYLLYGKVDYLQRMCACIFDPRFKLRHIGRSAVQELLGWVNKEDIPICNSRTLKALRWLGFSIAVTD